MPCNSLWQKDTQVRARVLKARESTSYHSTSLIAPVPIQATMSLPQIVAEIEQNLSSAAKFFGPGLYSRFESIHNWRLVSQAQPDISRVPHPTTGPAASKVRQSWFSRLLPKMCHSSYVKSSVVVDDTWRIICHSSNRWPAQTPMLSLQYVSTTALLYMLNIVLGQRRRAHRSSWL